MAEPKATSDWKRGDVLSAEPQLERAINQAFLVSLLLTSDAHEAERAVLEAIEASKLDEIPTLSFVILVSRLSLRKVNTSQTHRQFRPEPTTTLPTELRHVLNLPAELRQSFVLRILLGLSNEACGCLLGAAPHSVAELTLEALVALADVHKSRQREDVADMIAFLASDGTRRVTAAVIPVDGGSKL